MKWSQRAGLMFKNGILCDGMLRRIARPHQGRVLCGDSSGYHYGGNLGEEMLCKRRVRY